MKNWICILLGGIFAAQALLAQPERPNALSLEWGFGTLARQDLIFSPFVHQANSALNLGLSYERDRQLYQKAGLRFSSYSAGLTQPYGFTVDGENKRSAPHQFTLAKLDYALASPILERGRSRLLAGGALLADVQVMDYVYGRLGYTGYFAVLGVAAYGRYEYAAGERSRLSIGLHLPLRAWLARSPFAVNDDEYIENISSHQGLKAFFALLRDGRWANWRQLQYANFEVGYQYQAGERTALGLHYQLGYARNKAPRELRSLQQVISLSAAVQF